MNFAEKYVVITGASSGIGEALALAFASRRARLVLAARSIEKLELVKAQCLQLTDWCEVVPLDLADFDSIAQAAQAIRQKVPQVDILVNNAGISQRATAIETLPEVEATILQTNFIGPVRFTKWLLPHFNKNQSSIIVISSVVGLFGFPLRSSYAASKHALHGYFESMALESGNPHILIVCPGRINTPISLSALQASGEKHAQVDPGQANGIPADVCAQKIVKALGRRKKLILIARGERILWYIRRLSPSLFSLISKKISAV
jgi:short-subunit dehydrogenase